MEPVKNERPGTPQKERSRRPLLLTTITLFSFVYFGILSLLLLMIVLYSKWVTGLMNTYNPGSPKSGILVTLVFILLFLLHALCFTGTLMIFRLKKRGFYLYAISALVLSCYQLFRPQVPLYSTAIPIALLILLGAFFKRLS